MKIKKKNMTERISWEDFRNSGMLWFVNRILHVFGVSIVMAFDITGKLVEVYPVRCKWRGFDETTEKENFAKISRYMKKNASELEKEVHI